MNNNLKERIKSFHDLGILFQENFSNKKRKTFPKWDLILNRKLKQANLYNSWFTPSNLKLSLKNWGNILKKKILENWLSNYKFKIRNHKTIAIIMAGNIPIVGFHDLVCSMLLNFKCLIKLSSDDKILIPFIVNFLEFRNPNFKSRITFQVNTLKNFDAVIATGSDNSHKYFEFYFKNYPNLLRKTRHSIAVLNGHETEQDLSLLSNDIFNYFGLGCRSVSKVFIPEGYNLDLIFNACYKHKNVINHDKYANNFDYNKAVYLMNQEKFFENGFIILKEDSKLGSPVGCLYYQYYNDIKDVYKIIEEDREKIQCVVINDKNNVAFGSTQCPKLDDYADNIDTLDFLLKI